MKSLFMIGCAFVAAGWVMAGQPQPPTVVYGQIRDEYGQPMDGGVEVAVLDLSNASNECGTYLLDGAIFVGVNYRITVPLEDGVPLVRPNATVSGRNGKLAVRMDGVDQATVPAGTFTIPEPGVALRLDLSIAQDSDGDGLPDAWEELMVAWSGGMFSSIEDIDPDGDPDGDGMSTYREYLAGTLPFLATDIFEIVRFDPHSETGRIALSFSTVAGRKYHLLVSSTAADNDWLRAAAASTSDGVLEYQIFDGTGRELTVYVDDSYDKSFFRVGAN